MSFQSSKKPESVVRISRAGCPSCSTPRGSSPKRKSKQTWREKMGVNSAPVWVRTPGPLKRKDQNGEKPNKTSSHIHTYTCSSSALYNPFCLVSISFQWADRITIICTIFILILLTGWKYWSTSRCNPCSSSSCSSSSPSSSSSSSSLLRCRTSNTALQHPKQKGPLLVFGMSR